MRAADPCGVCRRGGFDTALRLQTATKPQKIRCVALCCQMLALLQYISKELKIFQTNGNIDEMYDLFNVFNSWNSLFLFVSLIVPTMGPCFAENGMRHIFVR